MPEPQYRDGDTGTPTHGPVVADVPTGVNASASDNAAAINAMLAALRSASIIASS